MSSGHEFAIADVLPGKLNSLVKNLMRQMKITDPNEAVWRFNSGEWIVVKSNRRWREKDGVIYFSVTSDGTTGEQWVTNLEALGFRVGDVAKTVLRSSDFVPTSGVTTEIGVLPGNLFKDSDRITKKIRAEADRRDMTKPSAEVGCLIRKTFSDEEIEAMGLWAIIAMHDPINDSGGRPSLLGARRSDDGRWLDAFSGKPGYGWGRGRGFAVVVPQVGPGALVP